MFSHPRHAHAGGSAPGAGTRPWRDAWVQAAYGPEGFWSTEQPQSHLSTGALVGDEVGGAVAALVPDGAGVVVDVGAGDGALLATLARLLPGTPLLGIDRRPRPADLPSSVGWVVDDHDIGSGRWAAGPEAWLGGAGPPFVVAHEWLDDLPTTVAGRAGASGWREVEVDAAGAEELGAPVGPDDRAWLDRWWPGGDRAEVGRTRDAAWAGLVEAALARGGQVLAIDYGHRADGRPAGGSLTAYGSGRVRRAVPDGSVNLTASVAVDALAAAGEAAGARILLLERQSTVLHRLVPPVEGANQLADLARRSVRSAATSPRVWGDLWWLLQAGP